MTRCTTDAYTATITASSVDRVIDGFAEFGTVRAVPVVGRVVVRTRILHHDEALRTAADVLGAVRWLAQYSDTTEPAGTVEVLATLGSRTDENTTWPSGIRVAHTRYGWFGATPPRGVITAPRGGYTASEVPGLLGDLIGAADVLRTEYAAYHDNNKNADW